MSNLKVEINWKYIVNWHLYFDGSFNFQPSSIDGFWVPFALTLTRLRVETWNFNGSEGCSWRCIFSWVQVASRTFMLFHYRKIHLFASFLSISSLDPWIALCWKHRTKNFSDVMHTSKVWVPHLVVKANELELIRYFGLRIFVELLELYCDCFFHGWKRCTSK